VSSDRRQVKAEAEVASQVVSLAAAAIESTLDCELVGLIGKEGDGRLFIIPSPVYGADVLRALAEADWPWMVRQAEEWYP